MKYLRKFIGEVWKNAAIALALLALSQVSGGVTETVRSAFTDEGRTGVLDVSLSRNYPASSKGGDARLVIVVSSLKYETSLLATSYEDEAGEWYSNRPDLAPLVPIGEFQRTGDSCGNHRTIVGRSTVSRTVPFVYFSTGPSEIRVGGESSAELGTKGSEVFFVTENQRRQQDLRVGLAVAIPLVFFGWVLMTHAKSPVKDVGTERQLIVVVGG